MKNKQISVNFIANIISMIIATAANFILTPLMINNLGLEAYGYIGLITNVLAIFTVFTYIFNSMIGRFYTFSINREGILASNSYISTSFWTAVGMIVLLLPLFTGLSWKIQNFILVEAKYLHQVHLAMIFSCGALLLTVVSTVMSTGTYAYNRLDLSNYIKIICTVMRVILLIMLFKIFTPQIWYVGLANCLEMIASCFLGYFLFKRLQPRVSFNIKLFDVEKMKEILKAGSFNTIILLGTVLMSQMPLLIGNRCLNATEVGILASIMVAVNGVNAIGGAISSSFSPTTAIRFANGGIDALKGYSRQSIQICAIIVGWPVVVFSASHIFFFAMWLNKDYSAYTIPVLIMTIPLCMICSMNQTTVIQQTINKLTLPSYASIVIGSCSIGVMYFLGKELNFGFAGIALGSTIALLARNFLFSGIYTAILLKEKWYYFFGQVFKYQIIVIASVGISHYLSKYTTGGNLRCFLLTAILATCVYFGLVFFFLSKEDKIQIKALKDNFRKGR